MYHVPRYVGSPSGLHDCADTTDRCDMTVSWAFFWFPFCEDTAVFIAKYCSAGLAVTFIYLNEKRSPLLCH